MRGDGHITLYVDSALEADRAALDCPGIEIVHAPDLVGEVDAALDRMRNRSLGAAPQRLIPRRIAARAADLKMTDETGFIDRLLMQKLRARSTPSARRRGWPTRATRCSCRPPGRAAPTTS